MFNLFQLIAGFVFFFLPCIADSVRAFALPIHRFSGLAIFALVTAAVISGLQEKVGFGFQL